MVLARWRQIALVGWSTWRPNVLVVFIETGIVNQCMVKCQLAIWFSLLAFFIVAAVLLYFKHTGIQFISIRAYNYIQSAYLVPSVRNVWQRHQENILSACQGKQVNLGGDGRCDSPGYCAKYGSYSCKVQVRSWQLLHSSKNSSGKIMTTASCCTRKYTWVLVTGYIVSIKTSTIHQ